MQTIFKGKHFITLQEWTKEEIDTLLEVSFDLKKKFAMGLNTPYLENKTMFLIFFEQSTRTRNSMEAGIAQLGGHANYLDTSTMQEKLETLKRKKVSIIWAYATSHKKPISVPLSQVLLFPRYGMDVWLAYPKGYELPDWVIDQAKEHAEKHGGSLTKCRCGDPEKLG